MNSLEAEYSFLMPTWKLPSVPIPSSYSRIYGASNLPSAPELGPDWATWNNTMYNTRYIPSFAPSTVGRRAYPVTSIHQRQVPLAPQQQHQQHVGGRQMPAGHHPPPPNSHSMNEYGANGNPDDGLNLTISLHPSNEYESTLQPQGNRQDYYHPRTQIGNRTLTYATNDQYHPPPPPPQHHYPPAAPSQAPQKRRVQIIDHNRQTPSTINNGYTSDRESHNSVHNHSHPQNDRASNHGQSQQKHKSITPNQQQRYDHHIDEKQHDSKDSDGQPHNNVSIHEYLYGLSAPDPGSYVSAYKNHQRRLHEEKTERRPVLSEYKQFVQNGGFGPAFANNEYRTYHEKIDTEKKKKFYSKAVRETNQHKLEDQKRFLNNGGQQRNRTATLPVPKYRRAREYADKIEKPHHQKPLVRLRDPTSGKVIIQDARQYQQQQQRHQRFTS